MPNLPYIEAIAKETMRLHPVAPMLVPRRAREDVRIVSIEATLANLLHGFNWKLPGTMTRDDLNMEEIFGLSTPKKFPLQTVAEPRLPPHMYNF
ncbi:hypothetical protein E3N88_44373 [Mikania micrantha]|uniref:Cytochrome P450 n=1 Tax=Mikania micrantha TaxID=192012 RepID=A0A5N6LC79_9ASTR|nr:hypothetical protein E3N88_44373 [Mikania micrantha]